MTVTKRRPVGARSTKIRPNSATTVQTGTTGKFPPPTEISEQLAVDNLALAKSMAYRMALNTKMPFDDLFRVASIGLLKGCRKYDPTLINPETNRPYALSTFLVPCIRGDMMHYLRDKGHSSGVKFPDRWRDVAPTVRKMANNGSSVRDIHEAIGLSYEDIEGILQSQRATTLLDPDTKNNLTAIEYEPDELDQAEYYDELSWALDIADKAYDTLPWCDKIQIESNWENTANSKGGRKLATQQHKQFIIRARRIIRGLPCPTEEQTDLTLELPIVFATEKGGNAKTQRLSKPKDIIEAIQQLILL